MNYGISGLSIIPVRKEPSEQSEMITQILYGEHFIVYEVILGWAHIRQSFDGSEGWVDLKMITPLAEKTYQKIEHASSAVTTDIFNIIPINKEQTMMIVAGSTLPCWRPNLKEFTLQHQVFRHSGNVEYRQQKHINIRKLIIDQALKYYNAPYLWGGRSPLGIDCSGLSQIIYKMAGIVLPREANQQVHCGKALSFVEETKPGDLAFFDNNEGQIIHVGIIWEKNKIIHASGQVRIDNVDQFGIFNVDTKRYTHQMRVMKQIIKD
jgi:gamma-D-glutamyl-L-lysine dipeptidyl-peptidase